MNKMIFFSIALFFLIFSEMSGQGKYRIEGTLSTDSLNGKIVMLENIFLNDFDKKHVIDSAVISNNKFILKGDIDEPVLARITINNQISHIFLYSVFLVLEQGEVLVKFENQNRVMICGTEAVDDYNKMIIAPWIPIKENDSLNTLNETRIKKMIEKTWTQEDELRYMRIYSTPPISDLFEIINKNEKAFIEKYIDTHPAVIAGMIMTLDNLQRKNYIEKLKGVYSKRVKVYFEKREKKMEELRKKNPIEIDPFPEQVPENVQVGKHYTDLICKTPDGNEIELSEVLAGNKLMLLDFWASWCGPCIKEMPFIKTLHEEFKDKGLVVLGVSIDRGEEDWKKALARYDMPWQHIISQEIGAKYYVNSIPYTIIIDDKGIIRSRRLRGEALKRKIEELLGDY